MTAPTDNAALRAALEEIRDRAFIAAEKGGYIGQQHEMRAGLDDIQEIAATALAAATPRPAIGKTLRQVMASGDPDWPGGAVERDGWFAGYDAAVAEMRTPTDRHAEGRIAGLHVAMAIALEQAGTQTWGNEEPESIIEWRRGYIAACEVLYAAIRTIANGGTAA